MRLADAANGRNNNFNLIRLLAAFAVLLSHSYALAIGPRASDPLSWLGITLGEIAVDVFFVTSGFLVTSSLFARQDLGQFVRARLLRIYPAHLVMLALLVCVVGPIFTTLSLAEYFDSGAILPYLLKTGTLVTGVKYELPGVFDSNPYPHAVNGSLWTMPFELKMYAILGLLGLILSLFRGRRLGALQASVTLLAICAGAFVIADHFWRHASQYFAHFFYMFFTGAALYANRTKVDLSTVAALTIAVAIVISAVNRNAFFVAYTLGLPYLVVYLAYALKGPFLSYNRLGDYSYGIYIYAFPVQQIVAATLSGIGVVGITVIAGVGTLAISVASWHFIERPALRLKGGAVNVR